MTGSTSIFGRSTDDGARLAIEEINAAGGVLGRPIELVTEDDRSSAEEARTAAEVLIRRDGVVALLGEIASSRALAIGFEAQRARIPMISPGASNPRVTQVGDYVFRACFIDPYQGSVMARFALDELKAKRLAVLVDSRQDYSVGIAKLFRDTVNTRGGEIVAAESYASGDIEFRSQLATIRSQNPDAIFIPGYYTEVGPIARQARELGITVPLLGADGWDSDRTIEIGGAAVEGSYFTTHYAADSEDPRVQEFVKRYTEKYSSTPDAMAALGYDTTKILADAMTRAGTTEGPKLRDAIAATAGFQGVTGKISMDAQRNAHKDAVVIKIDGGTLRYHATVLAE